QRTWTGVVQVGDDVNISPASAGGKTAKALCARKSWEFLGHCAPRQCNYRDRPQAGRNATPETVTGTSGSILGTQAEQLAVQGTIDAMPPQRRQFQNSMHSDPPMGCRFL
ncbi:MAG: hypothetical protein KBH45_06835, partial [Verrucomicrobia bacterium]|nr:hypothetical protein [Verrucomicrobiota bacterium]